MNALNALYDETTDFEILLFPCNLFGKQEPGDGYDEITNGVTYVRPGDGVGTPLPRVNWFEKVEVNGVNEPAIYTFLKAYCGPTDDEFRDTLIEYSPLKVGDCVWNFAKFLIGKDGKQYTRYHPTSTAVSDLEADINYLLAQPAP